MKKSLYGLKQPAKCWNERIHDLLTSLGFRRGNADMCFYSNKVDGKLVYLLLYVDDIVISCEDKDKIHDIIAQIKKSFNITNLGPISMFLGIQVEKYSDGNYSIHQENYINKILQDYNMEDCKPSKTPMDCGYYKLDAEKLLASNELYRRMIGSLLYLSTHTRPDIAACVSILCRKVNNPSSTDFVEIKRILRYLQFSKKMKLQLGDYSNSFKKDLTLVGYADTDFAGDPSTRKSTHGFVFKLGDSVISWASRKQTCVALSSTQAEYIGLSEASQECVWLKELLKDFSINISKCIMLEDNQSSLKLLENKMNSRTKHIDIKYHHIRQLNQDGIIEFKYCPTSEMIADMMTKPLGNVKLSYFRNKVGLTAD